MDIGQSRLSLRERTCFRGAKGDNGAGPLIAHRDSVSFLACACLTFAAVLGCGTDPPATAPAQQVSEKERKANRSPKPEDVAVEQHGAQNASVGEAAPNETRESDQAASAPEEDNSLAAKSGQGPTAEDRPPSSGGHPQVLRPVDEQRIAAAGIRKLSGSRFTLYTDLPVDRTIEELLPLFEQGVPQWCDYFRVDPAKLAGGHVRGCLMKDKARFSDAGLLPAELPAFANGYTRGNEIWWFEQNTDYYRRHLMLHEATHAFMYSTFGTCGPPWYMEGLAELLATHRLADGRLMLGYFPTNREEVPDWGRIKIVREAVQSGRPIALDEILDYAADAYLKNEAYGWSWAVAAFLDGHPAYRDRFRALIGDLKSDDFDRRFRARFADDWRELNIEWQVFIHELDYGYDLVRNAMKFHPGEPLEQGKLAVAADRGWQSSGVRVEPGVDYEVTSAGRYQVAERPKVWWCEPDGVTIRYHRGEPLGKVLAMVLPDDLTTAPWPAPIPIGTAKTLSVQAAGVLCFKINDSPAELSDNAGSVEVKVIRSFNR
jgi:hypothetical protein